MNMYIYIELRVIEEDVLVSIADPVCVYIHVYIHKHVCVYIHVYIHKHACLYIRRYIYTYIYIGLRFMEKDVLTYIADPDTCNDV